MDYNFETAEIIGKKTRALKHCNKTLEEIDKRGSTVITLNCTGVSFTVRKGDAMYLQLQATRAQLIQEIGSYQIVKKAQEANTRTIRTAPAPVGAADTTCLTDDELKGIETSGNE